MAGVAGLSCVQTHVFDAREFDCSEPSRPQCCESCGGAAVANPLCMPEGWVCPVPTVSSLACPNPSFICPPPVVNQDGGSCADAGAPSEEAYTSPGCTPESQFCPNDGTLRCALRGIQAQNDTCQFTADCVPVPEVDRNCTGWGLCPPFVVSADRVDEFLAAAQVEVDRYCACPKCSWSTTCPADAGSAHCVFGHCTWVPGPVSFRCADRRTGACFGGCAADEACFTQVTCAAQSPDGGCVALPLDGGLPAGDDLCHPLCDADGGCPEGQSCFLTAFNGCDILQVDGGVPLRSICCAADAGCGSR
jgi:hypothetical protein